MTGGGAGRRLVQLVGGPLDGEQLDLDEGEDPGGGAYMVVDGWEQRADYEPEPGADPLLWRYRGPVDA